MECRAELSDITRYGDLFDHVEDTLSVLRFQVFDFEAMRAYPVLIEPLLFYVLHRVRDRGDEPGATGLKLCVMDEAWRFIQHPTLRAYVEEALKTWRKRNAAMLLATQSVDDFASADPRCRLHGHGGSRARTNHGVNSERHCTS